MLPPDLINLILSFHRSVCHEEYQGDPAYQLYWAYDINALRELIGMTSERYRQVKSSFGKFLRKNRNTIAWLARLNHPPGGLVQYRPTRLGGLDMVSNRRVRKKPAVARGDIGHTKDPPESRGRIK